MGHLTALHFWMEIDSAQLRVAKKGLPMESKKALMMDRYLVDWMALMTVRSWE